MDNYAKKTSNFLNAIEKYADEQKNKIESEVEEFKNEELKKAEDEGLKDAYALIQKEIAACKTGVLSDLAKREAENKKVLFERREKIQLEVFEKAANKLRDFTATSDYITLLTTYANAMSEYFKGNACTLYVKENDKEKASALLPLFSGSATVKTDSKILIGGLRGTCDGLGIVIDSTLDTKLNDQTQWFLEHSKLSVV